MIELWVVGYELSVGYRYSSKLIAVANRQLTTNNRQLTTVK